MAYDETLAERTRALLSQRSDVQEKRMFGGLAFMVGGHMCVGVQNGELMARVGPESADKALKRPGVRPMDFTGRALKGMIYVEAPALRTAAGLRRWVNLGVEFVSQLPAKKPKTTATNPAPGKATTAKTPAAKTPAAKTPKLPAAEGFAGFPRGTFAFLLGLEAHNTKLWFDAHKADYQAHYVTPALAFVSELGPRLKKLSKSVQFAPKINGSLFRIQRDLRFVKSGDPYKAHLDLLFWEGERRGWDASNFFMRLAPRQITLGVGIHRFEKPTMEAYRAAVVNPRSGAKLDKALDAVRAAGPYTVQGATRKKVPRGFNAEHPRAAALLHDGLYATVECKPPNSIGSADFVDECASHFAAMLPLHRWLLGLKK
jgi:uncharacterized protein (TIGR02453 family)